MQRETVVGALLEVVQNSDNVFRLWTMSKPEEGTLLLSISAFSAFLLLCLCGY